MKCPLSLSLSLTCVSTASTGCVDLYPLGISLTCYLLRLRLSSDVMWQLNFASCMSKLCKPKQNSNSSICVDFTDEFQTFCSAYALGVKVG